MHLESLPSIDIARARAADYLSRLADIRPELTGKDLINLGVPRGPDIGRVLESTS